MRRFSDVYYAHPTTGRIRRTFHPNWIAHRVEDGFGRLIVPCRLHGEPHQLEPQYGIVFNHGSTYYMLMEQLHNVLVGPEKRLRTREALQCASYNSIHNLIVATQVFDFPAAFHREPDGPHISPRHEGPAGSGRARRFATGSSTPTLYGWDLSVLATTIAQLGTVLAFPTYVTCEQAELGYEVLQHQILHDPWADPETENPRRTYLYAGHVLHAFLSNPITYITTGILGSLPA